MWVFLRFAIKTCLPSFLVKYCCGLTLNSPSWAHVLNTQSPDYGAVFKNSGLARGSRSLGIDL